MTEPAPVSATVRRMLVGAQLRRLREEKGITRAEAGYTIRASESKMSRLELGRVAFKERDVSDLLMLYGVTDPEERDAVLALLEDANRPGWWREYEDVMPGWFQNYVGLEAAARVLRTYETHFVPGLLQTSEYARAVLASTTPPMTGRRDLDRAVALRTTRQNVLTRPNPLRVWAIMDEAALRRQVGSAEVQRGQLEHLLALLERPNVALQVLPMSTGVHAGGGSFSLLRFGDQDLPDVAYVEQLVSALYLDKLEHVERYTEVMDRLALASMTPEASADFIAKLLSDG